MTVRLLASLLVLGLPVCSRAAEPVRLQALVATSGGGAERLLDPAQSQGWTPVGDPKDEGVLFRFEEGTHVDQAKIWSCPGAGFAPFVDGAYAKSTGAAAGKGQPVVVPLEGRRGSGPRTLFLRMNAGPCLSKIAFSNKGQAVDVLPPRTAPGRVEASSVLQPVDAYHPSYLFDGRIDFGWVEGAKGPGVGESVTLRFDKPTPISAIEIWNGYQRSKLHYQKNARAKRIELSVDGGAPRAFALEDKQGSQKLALPAPVQARALRITVREVYRGTKYEDLVVSEMRLWDPEGPFTLSTPDREERRKALQAEISGKRLSQMVDRSVVTESGPDGEESLRLRGDHSFVYYASTTTDGREEGEVFDGAWVVVSQDASRAVIELFGRRHRTERNWDPYREGSGTEKQSEQISGGRLTLTWKTVDSCDAVQVSGRAITGDFFLPWSCKSP